MWRCLLLCFCTDGICNSLNNPTTFQQLEPPRLPHFLQRQTIHSKAPDLIENGISTSNHLPSRNSCHLRLPLSSTDSLTYSELAMGQVPSALGHPDSTALQRFSSLPRAPRTGLMTFSRVTSPPPCIELEPVNHHVWSCFLKQFVLVRCVYWCWVECVYWKWKYCIWFGTWNFAKCVWILVWCIIVKQVVIDAFRKILRSIHSFIHILCFNHVCFCIACLKFFHFVNSVKLNGFHRFKLVLLLFWQFRSFFIVFDSFYTVNPPCCYVNVSFHSLIWVDLICWFKSLILLSLSSRLSAMILHCCIAQFCLDSVWFDCLLFDANVLSPFSR